MTVNKIDLAKVDMKRFELTVTFDGKDVGIVFDSNGATITKDGESKKKDLSPVQLAQMKMMLKSLAVPIIQGMGGAVL